MSRLNTTYGDKSLGQRFGTSKMHLSLPQVDLAAVRSKAVVLLLLIVGSGIL